MLFTYSGGNRCNCPFLICQNALTNLRLLLSYPNIQCQPWKIYLSTIKGIKTAELLCLPQAFETIMTAQCQRIISLHPQTRQPLETNSGSPLTLHYLRIDTESYYTLCSCSQQSWLNTTYEGQFGVVKKIHFKHQSGVNIKVPS